MKDRISLTIELPVSPRQLYDAWLSSEEHSAFTGSPADIKAELGGSFKAWNGYISGRTLAMKPHWRILQAWRTTDFSSNDPDSLLEVLIEKTATGCTLTLNHSKIPHGMGEAYRQGWINNYLAPMTKYFSLK
jgi:activator of HSP90 ATPase